ncbi:17289_t:CDS:2 [Cetraspora pellucida]|uniref:17289_t:CDS:1 n=1 Tax=Cetraspora pellucida TaxID=1433469 RepID=A0A9N9A187_9GLOM|nr:17289_t:CDS:2 [Cetraspora pellucida]
MPSYLAYWLPRRDEGERIKGQYLEVIVICRFIIATNTVATALYKRVESGHWSGNYDQEVQNFVQTLEKVKKLVPNENSLRLEKLQSFGEGEVLEQRVMTAVEDMASLLELNALNVDTESWIDHAEENLNMLKWNVAHAVANANSEDEKLLWERLENDLKNVDLNKLSYNHPLCSGILDIDSSPISDLPETLLYSKGRYQSRGTTLETCDPPFGQWIENSENLKSITKRLLEALEGSYVCEVLAPLFSIALGDLSVKNETWRIWGDMASWPDAIQKGDSRIAYRSDLMFIAYLNDQRIDLLNMETGRPNSSKRKQEQVRLKLARLATNTMDFARTHLKQYIKKGILSNLLSIFSINVAGMLRQEKMVDYQTNLTSKFIGDDLRIYNMCMEYGIFKIAY